MRRAELPRRAGHALPQNQSGQAYVEYVLLFIFLAVTAITGLTITGVDVQLSMCQAAKALNPGNDCGHYFNDDFSNLNAWQIVSGA